MKMPVIYQPATVSIGIVRSYLTDAEIKRNLAMIAGMNWLGDLADVRKSTFT
ncbi:hypothetical protein ACFQI7_00575 [Paenibacillus allorhizosphaerae]|uniref:hypothetical protein n=1 Tax=Paenibacillus allorhizosphaerae TaxID=2849866 RepID=UPI0036159C42